MRMLLLKMFSLLLFVSENGDARVFKIRVDEKKLDWRQTSSIYQIYPRSFKDSDGDGIGDLKGIAEQAEYFKDIGIDAIWLNPVYTSPMKDMGYDISNYKAIDPIFGSMDDFTSLLKELKSLDIKLVLDFVPNHTSDEHYWFQKSVEKIDPYTEYYVWRDPKGWINATTPIPPNNWTGIFELPMWTYHPTRKQYYLHHFSKNQPDLDLRSKKVIEELISVLRFWLDLGVDGFSIDSASVLVEHSDFLDEPVVSDNRINGQPVHASFCHKYTEFQLETYQVLAEFREVVDSYSKVAGETRLVMVKAYGSPSQMTGFYSSRGKPIAQIPNNYLLVEHFNDTSTANDLSNLITSWMDSMPDGEWPNWILGNHDRRRVLDKFEPSFVDALNMLLLLLPGTGITYYGEEIGMQSTKIRWDQTTDVWGLNLGPRFYTMGSRDPQRTPMQWDSSRHAGFSKTVGKTWLPVNPNYYTLNVEAQKTDPRSHLNIYKNLTKLRSNEVFRYGDLETFPLSEWIFAFKRSLPNQICVVVINLNNEEEFIHFGEKITDASQNFTVILTTSNSEYNSGDVLDAANTGLNMRSTSGVVLREITKSA